MAVFFLTDYDSLGQLIEAHDLKNAEEIHRISLSDLWVRYLGGNGYVAVDVYRGEYAPVCRCCRDAAHHAAGAIVVALN